MAGFSHLVHHVLREMLMPRVRPRYVVEVEEYVYLAREEEDPDRLIEPDLAIAEVGESCAAERQRGRPGAGSQARGPYAA